MNPVCAMALGSAEPLTEMSTRIILWGGKGGQFIGLTTIPPSYACCVEIWEPTTCCMQNIKNVVSDNITKNRHQFLAVTESFILVRIFVLQHGRKD